MLVVSCLWVKYSCTFYFLSYRILIFYFKCNKNKIWRYFKKRTWSKILEYLNTLRQNFYILSMVCVFLVSCYCIISHTFQKIIYQIYIIFINIFIILIYFFFTLGLKISVWLNNRYLFLSKIFLHLLISSIFHYNILFFDLNITKESLFKYILVH